MADVVDETAGMAFALDGGRFAAMCRMVDDPRFWQGPDAVKLADTALFLMQESDRCLCVFSVGGYAGRSNGFPVATLKSLFRRAKVPVRIARAAFARLVELDVFRLAPVYYERGRPMYQYKFGEAVGTYVPVEPPRGFDYATGVISASVVH